MDILRTRGVARLWGNAFVRFGLLITAAVVVVLVAFPEAVGGLFRADQFMPHETCYLRNPAIILLHVSSDLVIGFSYVAISSMLAYLVYRASKDIPFHWMFLAFGLFIITCGFTHFMEVWTVWQAVYWLSGYVKLVCAVASAVTAVALYFLIPKVFALLSTVRVSEERRTKLETANRELEAFAYSVSHDLRAPLRAVQGMASALREDYADKLDPQARDYIDRINEAGGRMDSLIRDLLEYSRISRVEFQLTPVEIARVIERAKSSIASDMQQKQAEIAVPEQLPVVLANETLLVQVLENLLSNAIKFVPPGVQPRIQVSVRQIEGRVQIVVKDNGIGIAPEYRHKIFRIFERLHSTSEYPGTGIGLAIVEKAINRMGGLLGFESEPGKGSSFWVELQRA